MTLNIDIVAVEKLLASKGMIYVEDGQAGSLVSPKFSSKSFQFNKPFKVKCSSEDTLVFKICQQTKNVKTQTHVATAKLFASVLIKNFEKQLLENREFEYELDAYTPAEQYAGSIKMRIFYDKTEFFMGQIAGSKAKKEDKLRIYKGICPSKNLFNMLDSGREDQKNKWMESIYRDDMETMPGDL